MGREAGFLDLPMVLYSVSTMLGGILTTRYLKDALLSLSWASPGLNMAAVASVAPTSTIVSRDAPDQFLIASSNPLEIPFHSLRHAIAGVLAKKERRAFFPQEAGGRWVRASDD